MACFSNSILNIEINSNRGLSAPSHLKKRNLGIIFTKTKRDFRIQFQIKGLFLIFEHIERHPPYDRGYWDRGDYPPYGRGC